MIELELYRIDVANNTFIPIDLITTYTSLQWGRKENGIGFCRFMMNIWDKKATFDNLRRWRTQVAIKENNQVLFFGPIVNLNFNYQGVDGQWTVDCLDFIAHFSKRYVLSLTQYIQIDAGAIAWALLNTSISNTNGALGLYEGNIETTTLRDRTYEEGAEICSKLIDLTNVSGGFDFNFRINLNSNYKVDKVYFDVYAVRGKERNDLATLTIEDNVESLTSNTQDDIVNTLRGLGQGTGDLRLSYDVSDTTSQLDYTRQEKILTYQDISLLGTLQANVNEALRKNKTEHWNIALKLRPETRPFYGDFVVGDSLKYDLRIINGNGDGMNRLTGMDKVVELAIDVDEVGVKTMTPKLDLNL